MTFILGLNRRDWQRKNLLPATGLKQQGIQVVDADIVAREIVAVGSLHLQQIRSSFWRLGFTRTMANSIDGALREHIF